MSKNRVQPANSPRANCFGSRATRAANWWQSPFFDAGRRFTPQQRCGKKVRGAGSVESDGAGPGISPCVMYGRDMSRPGDRLLPSSVAAK